jgi:hypothetical protein
MVEMYAEDRHTAIERFTARLLEINGAAPPASNFTTTPSSLHGGGASGIGGGGFGARGAGSLLSTSPTRIRPS